MFDSNGNRCLLFCQANFFNPALTSRSLIYFCFLQPFFFSSGLVPSAFGYTHLGDCMIILTICLFGTRRGILVGAIVGGIAHIIGYTLVKIPLYGTVVAFGEMFTLSMQTIAGIVLGGVAYTILVQSPAIRTLKAKFA